MGLNPTGVRDFFSFSVSVHFHSRAIAQVSFGICIQYLIITLINSPEGFSGLFTIFSKMNIIVILRKIQIYFNSPHLNQYITWE